jgi:tetratricopeptide (TPR) repeat protein
MNRHICRRKNVFTIKLAHSLYYLRFTMVTLFQRLMVVTCLLTGGLSPLVMATEMVIAETTVAQSDTRADVQKLEVGKVIPATIEGDQKQSYVIPMEKGQYLELIVEQKSVDAIVTLFDPQGQQVLEMDITGRSEELVLAIAEQTGNYRLQVRRVEQDALRGDYRVRLVALKAASQNEKEKVSIYRKADKAFLERMALLKTGKPEFLPQVLEKLKEALRDYQVIGQPSIVGIMLINMGNDYTALEDYPRALDSYQQALAINRDRGELIGEASALQGIGTVYFLQGDQEESVNFLKQSLAVWQKMPERPERKGTLQLLAIAYRELKWYPGAKTTFQKVLSMDREQGDRKGEALTLWQLGTLYQELKQYADAVTNYEHSLKIFQDLKEHKEINIISEILAEIYKSHSLDILMAQGDKLFVENQDEDSYRQAIIKWEVALPIWRKAGDKSNEIKTLMKIGNVYSLLGQKTKSTLYFEQILKIYREQKDRRNERSMLSDLAKIYHQLGDKNKAADYQQQAFLIGNINDDSAQRQENLTFLQRELHTLQAKGDHHEEAITLNQIGNIYFQLGEYQKALDHFRLALDVSNLLKDDEQKANILVTCFAKIANVYKTLGEPEKALEYLQKILPLSSAINRLRLQYQTNQRGRITNIISTMDEQIEEADILQEIGIAYYDLEKKQQALDYLEKSLITKRTLGNRIETLRRIGVVYSGLADLKKALNHYQEALSLAKESSMRAIGAAG